MVQTTMFKKYPSFKKEHYCILNFIAHHAKKYKNTGLKFENGESYFT